MFNKVKDYFNDKKAAKEKAEEEARIEEELKKEEAKRKAKERKEQREKEKEEAAMAAALAAQEAKEKEEAKAAEEAQEAYLKKLQWDKEIATQKGEPWVALVTMDVDFEDLNNGAFELDWNDAFLSQLMRHGYQGKTDADLIDQWFTNVCRNVVLETYEQAQADLHPVKRQDLGGGRREYK